MHAVRVAATGITLAMMFLITTTIGSFAGAHGAAVMLHSEHLAPVTAPYTGAANAIRGVPGGGLPWVITRGEIIVLANGEVHARVRGLIIDPAASNPKVAGTNPIPQFKVTVSCLSTDAAGAPTTVNASTAPAPATATGDAEIDGMVTLAAPCLAPVAFIANGLPAGNGAWFAVNGR